MLDPFPRSQPSKYQLFVWPEGAREQLLPRNRALNLNLVDLLEQRQTRRIFKKPMEDKQLGEFLWLTCRNRSSCASPFGFDQESRVHPSAGATHPIHVLVARYTGPWMRYDSMTHALVELRGSANSVAASREAANRLIEIGQGVLLAFVAEPGKTAAKYENHKTLVWRDAGVILGYMSLVAEALGLAFCPLGITGQPYLTDYLPVHPPLHGVGLAIVGTV